MNAQPDLVAGPFPRRWGHSVAWRLAKAGRLLMGGTSWSRCILEAAWVVRRLALEEMARGQAGEFFDIAYPTLGVLQKNVAKTDRVLDLGCGRGRIALGVAPLCAEVVAVDYDAVTVAQAARVNRLPNIRWIHADVGQELHPAIKAGSFDWIVCSHVLEHLAWEQSGCLLRLLAGLGSKLLVELPDFSADPLNEMRRRRGLTWVSDADHKQEFTSEILARLLQENGWEVRSVERRSGILLALAAPRSELRG